MNKTKNTKICPNSTSGKHKFEEVWDRHLFYEISTGKIKCGYCGIYKDNK